MSSAEKAAEFKRIFHGLWSNEDYVATKQIADNSAASNVPMLTKLATAVDTRGCGSLGTRSVRKQIQALLHFAIGNQKLRVNAISLVPSTSAVVVAARVGQGKSLYHTLFSEVMRLMRETTEVLDKQIHDTTIDNEEKSSNMSDSIDLGKMFPDFSGKSKKQNSFKSRQMLRNPGTKEG